MRGETPVPQINLTGAGGSPPGGGGKDALESLLGPRSTEAQKRSADRQYRDDRALAEFLEQSREKSKRFHARNAAAEQKRARDEYAASQKGYAASRNAAHAEDRERDLRKKSATRAYAKTRDAAYAEDREVDLRRKAARQGFAKVRDAAYAENREFDLRKKSARQAGANIRSAAEAENREFDLRKRAKGRAYDRDRAAAEYENRGRDFVARKRERVMSQEAKRVDREAKAAERADKAQKWKKVRRANLQKFVRDDESNLGTVAAGAGIARAAGWIGVVAKAVIELGEAVAESPRLLATTMNNFVGGAKPYRDLMYGSASLGRQGGYDGGQMADQWQPSGQNGRWRSIRGLTSDDLTSVSGAYGIASRSVGSANGIIAASADADLAPMLGGMGKERYASALGLAQTLGLKGDGGFGASGDPGHLDQTGYTHNGPAYSYMRDWQRTMTAATAAGMDHSQVMTGIEGLMRQSASMGAAEVNAPRSMDAWWKMASSGSPGSRTGDEQASALSGMASQVESGGLGGGVVPNAVFHSYLSRQGGLPRDAAGVAKMLGVDPSSMEPGEKRKFDSVVQAAQSGNESLTFEYAKPFLQGQSGSETWRRMVDQSGLAPSGALHDVVSARLLGTSTGSYQDYASGQSSRPAGAGMGVGDIRDDVRASIYAASDSTGVSSRRLAALMSYETGGKFDNSLKSGTGAVGLGQITRMGIEDVVGGDKPKAKLLWEQSQTDQGLNANLTARYYALLKNRWGSDHEALRHYHGLAVDKNGIGPDQYAAGVEAREAQYANDPHKMNGVAATQSDLNVQAGHVSENYAETMAAAAPLMVGWNKEVIAGTGAVGQFTAQLLKAAQQLALGFHMPAMPSMPHITGSTRIPTPAGQVMPVMP